jgi:hypothetical protein
MSTGKFTWFIKDLAGKSEAGKIPNRNETCHEHTIMRMLMVCLLAVSAPAQNPPESGNPYISRGNPKSPNGKYEWIVRTDYPIRYALIDIASGKTIASVKAYYPDVYGLNIQFAQAIGVFWNRDGTVVALDELNRRRAGRLYFFTLRDGDVREMPSESILPIAASADEGRLVVDPGWVSRTKIRVRLALQAKSGNTTSRFYDIDFSDPDRPTVRSTQLSVPFHARGHVTRPNTDTPIRPNGLLSACHAGRAGARPGARPLRAD